MVLKISCSPTKVESCGKLRQGTRPSGRAPSGVVPTTHTLAAGLHLSTCEVANIQDDDRIFCLRYGPGKVEPEREDRVDSGPMVVLEEVGEPRLPSSNPCVVLPRGGSPARKSGRPFTLFGILGVAASASLLTLEGYGRPLYGRPGLHRRQGSGRGNVDRVVYSCSTEMTAVS